MNKLKPCVNDISNRIKCIETKTECWEVISHKPRKRDNRIMISIKGIKDYSYRWVYKKYVGSIPKGLYVLHKCDNPKCVNISHLFLGTAKDNYHDAMKKGRAINVIGERHGLSKLKNIDVINIRNSKSTYRKLANIYSVNYATIGAIKQGRTWRHLL